MDILNVRNNINIECDKMTDMYIDPTDEEILNLVKVFPHMFNNIIITERIRNINCFKKTIKIN